MIRTCLNQVLQCPGGAWWSEHGTLNQVLQCPGGAWWSRPHGTLNQVLQCPMVGRGGQNMGLLIKCYNVLVGRGGLEHGTLNQVLQCPGRAWWSEHGTLNQVLQCHWWGVVVRTWDS